MPEEIFACKLHDILSQRLDQHKRHHYEEFKMLCDRMDEIRAEFEKRLVEMRIRVAALEGASSNPKSEIPNPK